MGEPPADRHFVPPPAKGIDETAAVAPIRPAAVATGPAERILRRHGADLLAIDGVVGHGIGATQDGDEAVVVYLLDAAAARRVPTDIEGVPVIAQVTGPISASPS